MTCTPTDLVDDTTRIMPMKNSSTFLGDAGTIAVLTYLGQSHLCYIPCDSITGHQVAEGCTAALLCPVLAWKAIAVPAQSSLFGLPLESSLQHRVKQMGSSTSSPSCAALTRLGH